MWEEIKDFTGAVARHSGLVMGSNVLALIGFVWTLYENLHYGPGLRAVIASLAALFLLLVAAFLTWRQERHARRRAEDAFEWRKLADDFTEFKSVWIAPEWTRDLTGCGKTLRNCHSERSPVPYGAGRSEESGPVHFQEDTQSEILRYAQDDTRGAFFRSLLRTGARTWEIRPIANNRNVELCWELCRIAGKRLMASQHSAAPGIRFGTTGDDVDRWLDAPLDVLHVGHVTGKGPTQVGGETAEFEHGCIKNLGEASQLMCLRLASQGVSFVS
jgi:hypothetical protein